MTTHSSDSHGELPSRTEQAREDARLVEETLAGNQLSFQLLVERYSDRLFALARHYTRNPVEIEDVIQESFLKAFRRLDTFHHQSSFYTWIYRIATNTILDFLKRRGRSPDQAVEDPEVLAHDPHRALFGGGEDGLEVPRAVVSWAARLLRPGGRF